ncbi:MAG: dihydropteroate synthase [Spirochaetes bacterium]|nr:dihydropteroate synthase [Spirochaetota bacterium]
MASEKLVFNIKEKRWSFKNKIYLMGVLNATPDSFFDGGRFYDPDRASERIRDLIKCGVDIIDLGGESTRPGSDRVNVKEELKRVLPLVTYIKKNYSIPVSVDTYKSEVARAVLAEGADCINDISGLTFDRKMARVIARNKASVVLMHIQGTPKEMQENPVYSDLMGEIREFLSTSIKIGLDNGIQMNNIIIDPGIGFGKTIQQNYIIIKKLEELKSLNRPILIGLSRKSLIGKVLKDLPEERLAGTIALNTVSILNGANMIRVHDAQEHKDVIKLLEFYFKA